MNEILLDGSNFECNKNNLPLLIHGEDKAGASLFTITFAANLFASSSKLLFLTGYHMAKEEFLKQVGSSYKSNNSVIFCSKDKVEEFTKLATTLPDINERVVIIKNIDLFDEKTFDLISNKQKIIISGNISKCAFKDKILHMKFKTKVIFSEIEVTRIPELQKYEGFLMKGNISGIATVKITK